MPDSTVTVVTSYHFSKRLLEMSSVTENNRIIPAIDKEDKKLVSVTDDILLQSLFEILENSSFCSNSFLSYSYY